MTTQTWVQSPTSTPAIAGTNATIDELLTGLNNHLVTNGVWWEVSNFNLGNHTLEIKRKVSTSPTGEFATVRILFFGGALPNAAALVPQSATPVSTALYACLSVDANTAGPPTAFTSGAPYSTKFLQGTRICTNADIVAANSPRISMWECEEMIVFCISCTTGWATYIGGKMIFRIADSTELWTNCPSGGIIAAGPTTTTVQNANQPWPIPTYSDSAAGDQKPCYWTGSAAKQFGRQNAIASLTPSTTMSLGVSGQSCILKSVILVDSAQALNQTEVPLGFARQVRFGPEAAGRQELQESAVTTAYAVQIAGGSSAICMWLDQRVSTPAAVTY
jgi:hypothetical protein